jgi:exodeoxyribonuclease VII small subunit
MSDESYSFSTARVRLEEIVTQVRKKDTSLEKSLDLLEEGVRLANACTELIDHADWTVGGVGDAAEAGGGGGDVTGPSASDAVEASASEGDTATSVQAVEAEAGVANTNEPPADEDAQFAPDDDAFGDAADEAWADDTPEFRDDESTDA